MTRAQLATVQGAVVEYRGELWLLGAPAVTSDGFVTAWGIPCDREEAEGEEYETGFYAGHDFFLGRLEAARPQGTT